jgi:tRNA(Ile)-lysidine synthetase-like protein
MSLKDIYTFWFDSPQFWFNSTPNNDEIITVKFKSILDDPTKISYGASHEESIGYILLYDQITRHVNRTNQALIDEHLKKIVPFVLEFYKTNKERINSIEFGFVMLPLRHTKSYDKFLFVLREAWNRINLAKTESDKSNYVRFIKASYERYLKFSLEDDQRNIEKFTPKTLEKLSDSILSILDKRCRFDLIQRKIFEKFIQLEQPDKIDKMYKISEYLEKNKKYILSLSGGVDSMVLSYILKQKSIDFVTVHISYENRTECAEEVELLREWCSFLGIELYVRRIHEIKRANCMNFSLRELYEDYTRDIRFNTYRLVGKIIGADSARVFLGHNKNDSFENILTNIASQSHYDNLRGMDPMQNISGILFYRPLLNTTKEDIYKFSELNFIPHLPNSTPSWSQRGKIRDQVKPTLVQWNPTSIESFFKLSNELGSYVKFIESMATDVAEKLIQNKSVQFDIKNIPTLEYYWLYVFRKNNIWISTKSNNNWIEKINFIKENFDKIHLNTLSKINLNKERQIFWKKINSSLIEMWKS